MIKQMGPAPALKELDPATRDEWYRELAGTDFLAEMVKDEMRRSGEAGVTLTPAGPQVRDYGSALFMANELAAAQMVPKAWLVGSAPNIPGMAIAMMAGQRVGLDALASVQKIMVVNGIPSLWGGAPLAVCLARPEIFDAAKLDEWWEYDGVREDRAPNQADFEKAGTAACAQVCRVGGKPYVFRFSVGDARKAGLWGASGKLYGTYPQRMLKHRAMGYAIADRFPDVLLGLGVRGVTTAEREEDEPEDEAPTRSTVLDRVAATRSPAEEPVAPATPAPAEAEAPQSGGKSEPEPPVATQPAKVAARSAEPPAALAGLVREVQASLPLAADVKPVEPKAAEAEPVEEPAEDTGEPDLAVLNDEYYGRLLEYGSKLGVSMVQIDRILPGPPPTGGRRPDLTAAGCYNQEELVAALKEDLKAHRKLPTKGSGTV